VSVVSAAALQKSIARGDRGGIWFLYGEEEYLREEAVDALIAAHLDPATRDFNLDQLRGTSLDLESFASICQTPALMSEWRVVVLRDAQVLASSARFRSLLDELTDRAVPGLALIIAADLADKGKAKVWQRLEKRAKATSFGPLPPGELPDWLIERARADGITIEPAAARALAAAAGPDLGRLVQELAKLRDFAGDRPSIGVDDVRDLVGQIPRQNRWDWFDTVGEARFSDARHALDVLLENESGVGLVIGLGAHLLRIGVAIAGGARALGEILPPYQRWLAQRIVRQARRWSAATVNAAIDDLLRADRLLKSTSLADRQVIEELLFRLENRHEAAA